MDMAIDIVQRNLGGLMIGKITPSWSKTKSWTYSPFFYTTAISYLREPSTIRYRVHHYPVSAIIAEFVRQETEENIRNFARLTKMVAPLCRRFQRVQHSFTIACHYSFVLNITVFCKNYYYFVFPSFSSVSFLPWCNVSFLSTSLFLGYFCFIFNIHDRNFLNCIS